MLPPSIPLPSEYRERREGKSNRNHQLSNQQCRNFTAYSAAAPQCRAGLHAVQISLFTYWIGGWVGGRTSLVTLERKKKICLHTPWKWNESFVVWPVDWMLFWSQSDSCPCSITVPAIILYPNDDILVACAVGDPFSGISASTGRLVFCVSLCIYPTARRL